MTRFDTSGFQRRIKRFRLDRDYMPDMQSKRLASLRGICFSRRFKWQTP